MRSRSHVVQVCEGRASGGGEQPRHVGPAGQFADEGHGFAVERNVADAPRERGAGDEKAVSEVHVFPAGVQNFRFARSGEKQKMDGLHAAVFGGAFEQADELQSLFGRKKFGPPAGSSRTRGAFERGVAFQQAPAHGAVEHVFDQPEQAVAGRGRQARDFQLRPPFVEHVRGNVGERQGAEVGKNVQPEIPFVRFPAFFVSEGIGKVMLRGEITKQR